MSIFTLPHKAAQTNVHHNNKNVVYVKFYSGLSIQNILKIWRVYGDRYSSYRYSTFKKQFFWPVFAWHSYYWPHCFTLYFSHWCVFGHQTVLILYYRHICLGKIECEYACTNCFLLKSLSTVLKPKKTKFYQISHFTIKWVCR